MEINNNNYYYLYYKERVGDYNLIYKKYFNFFYNKYLTSILGFVLDMKKTRISYMLVLLCIKIHNRIDIK